MRMLEYEGKAILRKHGIVTTAESVAGTVEEAIDAGKSLGFPVVVKAQVLAGGRGKAGGVRIANNSDAVRDAATAILGMEIKGEECKKLLVAKACGIEKELYAGVTIDQAAGCPVLIFSLEGGMDIEEVASKTPEKVRTIHLSSLYPIRRHVIQEEIRKAGLVGPLLPKISTVVQQLVDAFFANDCTTLEINPLVVTDAGEVIALDAKAVIDDSALKRQNLVQTDSVPGNDLERRAQAIRVNYVSLEGEVAIIAGGAGLAMATMDMVNLQKSTAASFMDLGGGISAENMAEALRISLATKGVRGVVINVFGGINNCLEMATGIAEVLEKDSPAAKIVVKMRGHSQDEGWALLNKYTVPIVKYGTTFDAVQALLAGM